MNYIYILLLIIVLYNSNNHILINADCNSNGCCTVQVQTTTLVPSRCADIVNYNVQANASQPLLQCMQDLEDQLAIADTIALQVSDKCYRAYLIYKCALIFKPCGSNSTIVPPINVCNNLNQSTTGCTISELTQINNTYFSYGLKYSQNFQVDGFEPICSSSSPNRSLLEISTTVNARRSRCAAYNGNVCSGLFKSNDLVYSPHYTTQNIIETSLKKADFLLNILPQTNGCREVYWKLVCAAAFPICDQTIFRPKPVSRYLCLKAHELCPKSFFTNDSLLNTFFGINNCSTDRYVNVGSQIQNSRSCSSTMNNIRDTYYKFPRFPYDQIILKVPSKPSVQSILKVNHMNDTIRTIDSNAEPDCPEFLVHPNQPTLASRIQDGACSLPCPSLLFSKSQYEIVDYLVFVPTIIGTILLLYLILSYIVFKRFKYHPFHLYFSCGVLLGTVSLAIEPFLPAPDKDHTPAVDTWYTRGRCLDNSRPSKEGFCIVQAITNVLGSQVAVSWWFIIAFDVFLKTTFRSMHWPRKYKRINTLFYYCLGFVYPFSSVAILYFLGHFGNALNGIPYCLITDNTWAWAVYYYPIGVMSFLGFIIMVNIIYRLIKTGRILRQSNQRKFWRDLVRPCLFVFNFLIFWTIVFTYRSYIWFNEDRYERDAKALIECLLVTRPSSGYTYECERNRTPPVTSWYFVQCLVATAGILGFTFIHTTKLARFWYNCCHGLQYEDSQTRSKRQSVEVALKSKRRSSVEFSNKSTSN